MNAFRVKTRRTSNKTCSLSIGTLSAWKQHSFVHFKKDLQFQINSSKWRTVLAAIHIFRKSDALITFLQIGPGLIRIAGCNKSDALITFLEIGLV